MRDESFYFYPVFACQIMNEGWASYWHARLLREADFLPQHCTSTRSRRTPTSCGRLPPSKQAALAINPYHLGFSMWERIVEEHGLERASRFAPRTTTSASSAIT